MSSLLLEGLSFEPEPEPEPVPLFLGKLPLSLGLVKLLSREVSVVVVGAFAISASVGPWVGFVSFSVLEGAIVLDGSLYR